MKSSQHIQDAEKGDGELTERRIGKPSSQVLVTLARHKRVLDATHLDGLTFCLWSYHIPNLLKYYLGRGPCTLAVSLLAEEPQQQRRRFLDRVRVCRSEADVLGASPSPVRQSAAVTYIQTRFHAFYHFPKPPALKVQQ